VQLFDAAMEVINDKKMRYVKAMNVEVAKTSVIYGESFYSFSPSQLYESYTPSVTSEYYDYGEYSKRKNLRTNTTYYYDKIDYSGFDKVINPIVVEPVVEYVLQLQMKFSF
jgi:hypothetical protein